MYLSISLVPPAGRETEASLLAPFWGRASRHRNSMDLSPTGKESYPESFSKCKAEVKFRLTL